MDILIEKPVEKDFDSWAELYRQYADFYSMSLQDHTLKNVWSWIHDENQEFYCLIARDQGKIVGLAHFRSMLSPLRGAKVGFLDDLFVAPDHRGKGIVDSLFEGLQQRAKAEAWPFVRWITADDNYRAQGFYKKVSDQTKWVTYQMNTGM